MSRHSDNRVICEVSRERDIGTSLYRDVPCVPRTLGHGVHRVGGRLQVWRGILRFRSIAHALAIDGK
jgi:hypothetical protein